MKIKPSTFRLFLILALSILVSTANAQNELDASAEKLPDPYSLVKDNLKQNNYITPLFDLKARESLYLAASPMLRSWYLDWVIQFEGYVGNYEQAYAYEDMLYGEFPSTKRMIELYKNDIADLKSTPVANFRLVDAFAAIEKVAENQQVIMINEEHRTPFHRALTLELLPKLYAKGFRYFAAETINEGDTELHKRGYPTQKSGTYTADPVYADAVRTALKLGYKIVPYESVDTNCKPTEENPEFCTDQRERGQARNLYERILKDDPKAKIFVHVGRGHNSKAPISEKFNFMGYYFKELSKIEPFTIDQLRFSERHRPALEQPLYRLLTKENILQKPSVYQSSDGKFYNQGAGYDMQIFHPRLSYRNGRATFLEMNGLRKAQKIDPKKLKIGNRNGVYTGEEPVLIQAFFKNESYDAVPIDQILISPGENIPVLMLPAGSFRIRALDKRGKMVGEYQK